MIASDLPDLVPARMLNEYVYCPRLFFLEWVDQLWASNADVAEGHRRHRRADAGGGAVPLPGEGGVRAARAVELASERLGIISKLDLLQGDHARVVPVETKKGHPAAGATAWPADAIQVCAQILLLREHGYDCEHGELFYSATRQRVTVVPSSELIDQTMAAVAGARAIAAELSPPPPLAASPKCPRCSLAGICLPDEISLLAGQSDRRPRRLITPALESSPLYVTEQGSHVGVEGGRLAISRHREQLATIRLIDVLHVCLYGNVQFSAQAMRALFEREIGVFHFSYGGWLLGQSGGLPSKNVMLRIRQVTAAARRPIEEPRAMIAGKIRNSRTLLRRNGGTAAATAVAQLANMTARAERAAGAEELLGIEGTAARIYFAAFPGLIPRASRLPGPPFTGLRNRRPPADAVNCLLSFCYGLLAKELLAACIAAGFDPYIGLPHRPRFGRPALALDLAEEFRPLLADSTVLTLINNGEVTSSDFIVRAGAVTLTADGRKAAIRAWERRLSTEIRHPLFGYKVTYRRAIDLQARILAAALAGELPGYQPLVTR